MGRHLLRTAGFFVLVVCLTSLSGESRKRYGVVLAQVDSQRPFTFCYVLFA